MQPFKPPANASLQLYLILLAKLRRILFAMGMDVMDPGYRPGWRVCMLHADIYSFLVCMAYTLYRTRHQADELLQCVCLVGVPMRGLISTVTLLWHQRRLERIHRLCVQLHRNATGRCRRVLLLWTRRAMLTFKLQVTLYGTTGMLIVLFPLVYYALYGELFLMLAIKVPGIDEQSLAGFLAVSGYEILCAYLSVGNLLAIDATFMVLSVMGCAYLQLVRVKCEQLTERLIGEEATEEMDGQRGKRMAWSSKRRTRTTRNLLDVIVAGQRADAFIESVCECFEGVCGMLMAVAAFSLALCVLAGRQTTWLMGYPLGVSFLYAMLSYSVIGSALERQFENVLLAMYAVPWYRMGVKERRLYVLMVLRWQHPRCVALFGSVQLNVATALQILKSIYSGYMMLDSTM